MRIKTLISSSERRSAGGICDCQSARRGSCDAALRPVGSPGRGRRCHGSSAARLRVEGLQVHRVMTPPASVRPGNQRETDGMAAARERVTGRRSPGTASRAPQRSSKHPGHAPCGHRCHGFLGRLPVPQHNQDWAGDSRGFLGSVPLHPVNGRSGGRTAGRFRDFLGHAGLRFGVPHVVGRVPARSRGIRDPDEFQPGRLGMTRRAHPGPPSDMHLDACALVVPAPGLLGGAGAAPSVLLFVAWRC